jgi:hypothetical protein
MIPMRTSPGEGRVRRVVQPEDQALREIEDDPLAAEAGVVAIAADRQAGVRPHGLDGVAAGHCERRVVGLDDRLRCRRGLDLAAGDRHELANV